MKVSCPFPFFTSLDLVSIILSLSIEDGNRFLFCDPKLLLLVRKINGCGVIIVELNYHRIYRLY